MEKTSEGSRGSRPRRGSATARRSRQVRWARRLRRVGLAWQNALEIIRAGRLTAPYGAPFDVVHEDAIHKLRHYRAAPDATGARTAPLLLVPPLMVASEVYDIAPDVSSVAFLARAGVDVWLVDFGAPEREAGGMDRTLDDHVRAVSDAIDRIRAATGRDVHLAGYSQGGMFAYQAAAFRRSDGIASIITMGSPVDVHRNVRLADQLVERLVAGVQRLIAGPLERIEGLPGVLTSTGFKLLSARKELAQLVEFVRKLHDRQALEKREARRLFLGGEGFVAWPGPALRKFIDEIIVANRMTSGGIVIDGHTVTLADIVSPILYFVGDRDEMGRPAAVRGIRRAAPGAAELFEVLVKAGHFGLVVGSTALGVTWPTVIEWIRWRDGDGPRPARIEPARAAATAADHAAHADDAHDDADDDEEDGADDEHHFDLELVQELLGKTATALWERVGDVAGDLGDYLDNLRWQLPRLRRLRDLREDTRISIASVLAAKAAASPDGTFFLFRDRAFTYADANRRVDAVVRGLIASGVRHGQRIAVMMRGRPSLLSAVTAISRMGAVSVLMSPETPARSMARAFEVGEPDVVLADPDSAAAVRAAWSGRLLVLGAAHATRALPAGAVDLEAIDPAQVALPGWYRPDPGRARDLAMVFVSDGRHEPPRASRITNRRWAVSALGAAATCALTPRDTVYCCLPLHHPTGMLVAASSAVIGGARLAVASEPMHGLRFDPDTFWTEVRRYGVSIVYYANEMCRSLVAAPPTVAEQNHPVRLFAGSGMRPDLWRKLKQRFAGVGVLEFYASTEASAVLANTSGEKLGALGRPLPGSPELAIAAYDLDLDDFVRDAGGRLVRTRIDQPGMLIVRLDSPRGIADLAHLAANRILSDAFAPGDTWFVTGDLLSIDTAGDYWYVDRLGDTIRTSSGPVPSRRIEDALHDVAEVNTCVAVGIVDPSAPTPLRRVLGLSSPGIAIPPPGIHELPAAAVSLLPGAPADRDATLVALARAVVALPPHARPVRLRLADELPMNDGFRPLKQPVRDTGFADGPSVYAWDPATERYRPTAAPAAATVARPPAG
ncbi:MAG TPA: alpha/beta fold hydrolase [Kofleriaceae bacterium]|nr:alpha/beta fold hydrolase [Kofleriaceae bacterium]